METELSVENKIVNGLWISLDGAPLSNLERLCIYSFCANGHDFHLWTYGDLPNIPADTSPGKVVVRDAAEILPQSKMFFVKKSLAGFSDWFRWKLMRDVGGWYVDMDIVALRPLAFEEGIVFVAAGYNWLNSNFMKFPHGTTFAAEVENACANPGRIVPWDTKGRRWSKRMRRFWFWKNAHAKQGWGESGGPKGFTLAAKHHGLLPLALPSWQTEMIAVGNPHFLLNGELSKIGVLPKIFEHAAAIHFFNEYMRRNGWDKNGVWDSDSPFEILKRRYLPELQK